MREKRDIGGKYFDSDVFMSDEFVREANATITTLIVDKYAELAIQIYGRVINNTMLPMAKKNLDKDDKLILQLEDMNDRIKQMKDLPSLYDIESLYDTACSKLYKFMRKDSYLRSISI